MTVTKIGRAVPFGSAVQLSPARVRWKFSNSGKARSVTSSSSMELTQNVAAWLGWLSRVRFLLITLLLALVIVLRQDTASWTFHPLFPSLDHPVVHAGDPLHDPAALDAGGSLARRGSDGLRPGHGHGPGVRDRDAGELFHLALSAGHHRRQHLVLAQSHVHGRGAELHPAGRPGRADLLQRPAAHADCHAQ